MSNEKEITKEQIIAEYLAGGTTYHKLQLKYGIERRKINYWVLSYQGKIKRVKSHSKFKEALKQESLPAEISTLRRELSKAKTHNKLLNALLDIGLEQYGIDLRKKTGAKRS